MALHVCPLPPLFSPAHVCHVVQSRFRCQKDAEFWRMEVAKYRELEPELEKARKRINDLERESNQHFSSIFDAPEEALSELRHLKQELLEVRT